MRVNGKHTELTGTMTVRGLIVTVGYREDRVAVELNGRIVPRSGYADTVLKDDDSVEIVGFVGGG
ncbi:MAG: sulfur carrier protein ThiS [Methanomassiliicoccaceae archaeon]|jgi:sulfur carrier protein|nr:sulfur carrier protein ThiS [Methanomassiliicoccaceae archaeon]